MPFSIALADANGTRISGSEVTLSPGPVRVDYPTEPAGSFIETPDGPRVKQQPSKDSRVRVWEWDKFPHYMASYERLYRLLEAQLSSYRVGLGLSPYVYVKDTETQRLRRWATETGTATGTQGGANVLTDTSKTWTLGQFTNCPVILVAGTGAGQMATINSNSTDTLVLNSTFGVAPVAGSTQYRVRYPTDDWFKARVVEVSRKTRDDGGVVMYDVTRFAFVLEDSTYNDLG
jgi:hypothetical protein